MKHGDRGEQRRAPRPALDAAGAVVAGLLDDMVRAEPYPPPPVRARLVQTHDFTWRDLDPDGERPRPTDEQVDAQRRSILAAMELIEEMQAQ